MSDHGSPLDALENAMGSDSFSDVVAEICEHIILGNTDLPECHKVEVRVIRCMRSVSYTHLTLPTILLV